MTKKPTQGWGRPHNAAKFHYFLGGRSLCCRWLYFGPLVPDTGDSPDCIDCRYRLDRIKKQGVKA